MEFDPAEGSADPFPIPLNHPVHHVGIAVRSIEEAAPRFEVLMGEQATPRQSLPEFGVDVCFVGAVELLEPHDSGGAIARFLERGGSTLHHVAFGVEDVRAELDRLVAAGFRPIDRAPRPGAHGTLVAFLHPGGTGGALVETGRASTVPPQRPVIFSSSTDSTSHPEEDRTISSPTSRWMRSPRRTSREIRVAGRSRPGTCSAEVTS